MIVNKFTKYRVPYPPIQTSLIASLLVISGCISPPEEQLGQGTAAGDLKDDLPDSLDASSPNQDSTLDKDMEPGKTDSDNNNGADSGQNQSSQDKQDPGPGDKSSSGSKSGTGNKQNDENDESSKEHDDNTSDNKDKEKGSDDENKKDDETKDDESGNEDEGPLHVEPSHGSAKVTAKGTNLTITPPNMKGQSQFTMDQSIIVGFLKPGTEYQIKVDDEKTTFTTPDNPHTWNNDPLIHPGISYHSSKGRCTLGFIFQDPTNETIYAMTAAHCVKANDEIRVDDKPVGKVAHQIDADYWDLALIEIYDRTHVSPSLPYFTGPSGLAHHIPDDDTLCFYGTSSMAYPFGSSSPPSVEGEARCGDKISNNSRAVRITGPSGYMGDSGSPVIHHETGSAYGIVSGGVPGVFTSANLICPAMDLFADNGFDLMLSTSPYQQQPPQPLPEPKGTKNIDWCY